MCGLGRVKFIPFSTATDCCNQQNGMVNTMQQMWGMGDTASYTPLTDVHGLSAISFGAENSPFKVTWEPIDWIPENKIWKQHCC